MHMDTDRHTATNRQTYKHNQTDTQTQTDRHTDTNRQKYGHSINFSLPRRMKKEDVVGVIFCLLHELYARVPRPFIHRLNSRRFVCSKTKIKRCA